MNKLVQGLAMIAPGMLLLLMLLTGIWASISWRRISDSPAADATPAFLAQDIHTVKLHYMRHRLTTMRVRQKTPDLKAQ